MPAVNVLSPEDLVPLCNQVVCRSSGSGVNIFPVFPQGNPAVTLWEILVHYSGESAQDFHLLPS